MALYPQLLLDTHEELIIDLFAGGGGASSGIEQALGRMVDVAINHDANALQMHEANHPQTLHLQSDIFEVDPRLVCGDRRPALLWMSPDCTDHSKAKGGTPFRDHSKKRRALAWIGRRWCGTVRPRVLFLENVEEFAKWGPLVGPKGALRPCKRRRGRTFQKFVKVIRELGYTVEWRELRACDYGAPTIRKRLFMIARCDGKPIMWPRPTHMDPTAKGFEESGLKPYRTAAECIDWGLPMCSIFATKEEAKAWAKEHGYKQSPKRPLEFATMRRTARGVMRFVVNNPKPFLVTIDHGEGSGDSKRWGTGSRDANSPLGTITCKGNTAVVSPVLIPRYGERNGQAPRCRSVEKPAPVVVPDANGASLMGVHLSKYYGPKSDTEARGGALDEPLATQPTENRFAVCATFLAQHNGGFAEGNSGDGHEMTDPLSTINGKGSNAGVVGVFIDQANGGFDNRTGREMSEPLSTILTESRGHHGLTAVHLQHMRGTGVEAEPGEPLRTIAANGQHQAVVAAHLMTNTSGHSGAPLDGQVPTIATGGHQAVVAAHIQRDFGQSVGSEVDEPIGTITGDGGGKARLVYSFLQTYYGEGLGQDLKNPLRTITTQDRFSLVTVTIGDQVFIIGDICMRMLWPHELYAAQGFRPGYIIDRGADGRVFTKTQQVHMCGNSVSPPVAEALVRANCPELIVRELSAKSDKKLRRLQEVA